MSSTLSEQVAELEVERDQLKERVSLLEAVPRVPLKDFSTPRVISREELRNGQWVAVYGEGEQWRAVRVQSNSDEAWMIQDSIGAYPSDTLVLLAEAPEPAEPELPTEPGSVILVTEWKGEKLDQPIYAMLDNLAHWVGAIPFSGGLYVTNRNEITGWKPIRIVTEDGEA